MAQDLRNIQQQRQEQQLLQQQRLTAQQMMAVQLLEMPLAQYEQNVQGELDENPAMESSSLDDMPSADDSRLSGDDSGSMDSNDSNDGSMDGDGNGEAESDRKDELDAVLDQIDRDDRMETSNYERAGNRDPDAGQEERVYANMESFYDSLQEQMSEQQLTDRQQVIMEYLIGSLDNDGLLRKTTEILVEEIAINEYLDVTEDEVERVINILQSFDPAGIGAMSLQQCLLIQILRRKPTHLTELMRQVIADHYKDFASKHWRHIQQQMDLSDATYNEVFSEIRRLNPRPGAAMGEAMGRSIQQVTPDFTVTVDDDDRISFTVNKGKVPQLHVSRDFEEMIEGYRLNPASMTRSDKEALVYAQQKVNRARMFIDAMEQRQRTMRSTMRQIIRLQREYFLSGDDSDLKPMTLRDIADPIGVDISTVSRVCRAKYAETPWGIIPMKSLFSDAYDTGDGEEVSTREIKQALKALVEAEEPGKPLSDIKLAAELKKQGYPIARRTVAKYREQLAIPPSNLRKN